MLINRMPSLLHEKEHTIANSKYCDGCSTIRTRSPCHRCSLGPRLYKMCEVSFANASNIDQDSHWNQTGTVASAKVTPNTRTVNDVSVSFIADVPLRYTERRPHRAATYTVWQVSTNRLQPVTPADN